MGLFDIFKKKQTGIEHSKFHSKQFQDEICALALVKIEENNSNPNVAKYELKKLGLNDEQINIILEKVKIFLKVEFNNAASQTDGIEEIKFHSESYKSEILEHAKKLYFENNQRYEVVEHELFKEGLSRKQAKEVVTRLEKHLFDSMDDFQDRLENGIISEIKIHPNPEHKKGNVDKDQIDKYIAYGAYQMERGDLDNALELFDKAIELDENATLAYANKGKLFSLKNDNEKALLLINKALDIEPHHQQILDNKVHIVYELLNENKIDEKEFIDNINDILTKDAINPNALIYIIQYYLKQNQTELALQSLKKLFVNYYNESITIQLMLNTFNQLSEEEALIQFAELNSEINEEANYQLNYNKGLFLKGKGKWDEAIIVFNELNAIQEFSWNFYQIAIIKNLQDKTEESLDFLKTTFNLEPELIEDAKKFPELKNLWSNPKFIELTK